MLYTVLPDRRRKDERQDSYSKLIQLIMCCMQSDKINMLREEMRERKGGREGGGERERERERDQIKSNQIKSKCLFVSG